MRRKTPPFAWKQVIGFGLGVLRLSPDAFWRMTPRELGCAIEAVTGRAVPIERAALEGLLHRFDDRTGRFKHYRHDAGDPNSLISNNVYTIYGDRSGQMWLGMEGGISRFDPATDDFVN
jgi:uncharacterized phage protein (TIGR02216 family)